MLTVYPPKTKSPAFQPAGFNPATAAAQAAAQAVSKFYSVEIVPGIAFDYEGVEQRYAFNAIDSAHLRYEARHGDHSPYETATGHPFDRVENASRVRICSPGQLMLINYLFMMEPGPINTPPWLVCLQVRQDNPIASPAFEMNFVGDTIGAAINVDDPKTTWRSIDLGRFKTLKRGSRYAIQIGLIASPDPAIGRVKIWMGEPGHPADTVMCDYRGPVGYKEMTLLNLALGIYRYTAPETLAVHYDALKVSYPKVMP